jgi:hypothetical protein
LPRKVTKRNRPGFAAAARFPALLDWSGGTNSRYALKQSSPTSPDQPALLGGAQGMKCESQNRKSGGQQVAHHTKIDGQNNSTQVH